MYYYAVSTFVYIIWIYTFTYSCFLSINCYNSYLSSSSSSSSSTELRYLLTFVVDSDSEELIRMSNLTVQDAFYAHRLLFELNVLPLAWQITSICGNVLVSNIYQITPLYLYYIYNNHTRVIYSNRVIRYAHVHVA